MSRSTACATAIRADGKRKKQIRRRVPVHQSHAVPFHRGFPPAWDLGKPRLFTAWTSDDCCISIPPEHFCKTKMNLRLQKVVIDYCEVLVTVTGPAVAAFYAAFTQSRVKAVRCNGIDLVSVQVEDTDCLPGAAGEGWKNDDDDEGGRITLPVFRLNGYRLQPGEVLAVSDYSPLSFDSRYFGTVSRPQVQSVVAPVWTW